MRAAFCGLIVFVLSACSFTVTISAGAGGAGPARRPAPPLPQRTVRNLPAGTFYLLTGPNPESFNLWQISNTGKQVRLTHNSVGFGISNFDASRAGVVMADAASSIDELARLTPAGARYFKDRNGTGPAINAQGRICFVRVPDNDGQDFKLIVKDSVSAPERVIYRQKEDITVNVWGPHQEIAIVSGGHAPGTTGPVPKLIIISRNGKVRVIRHDLGKGNQLGNVMWNEHKAGLAITGNARGEVIYDRGRRYMLPAGWFPQTWNPDGTTLLVERVDYTAIGLWSAARPHTVKVIGPLPKHTMIGPFRWLDHPARL